MLTKRIIACMDIAGGRVKKGVGFKDLQDAGDPVELAKKYSKEGVDELVFLDVLATVENRGALLKLVSQVAKEINIPFVVGGGVKTIQDIKYLLNAGADKVSIGSTAINNPNLVNQAVQEFGSQCIVISVDTKREGNSWKMYIRGGREKIEVDAIEFCKDMEKRGAGELLVNSLDKDGAKTGYDIELLNAIEKITNLPIIASSGAGKREDFLEVFEKTDVNAALAASLFHYGEIKVEDLKQYLNENNIKIRI